MVLTPIDVQQKTFATAMRGYDLDEVDDFLDNVVIALKDYEQRLRDAQERITTLESDLSKRSDEESAISRALVAAQRSADSLVEDAREEAQRILAEAESQASELEGDRDEQRRLLQEEVDGIRSRLERLRAGVATMLSSVSAGLDDIDRFVDEQEQASLEPQPQATFDAAIAADTEEAGEVDEVDEEAAVEVEVETEVVSEKIVIDGTDEIEGEEPAEDVDYWGTPEGHDEDEEASDDDFDGSPSLDEITDRIDAAFGDLDDDDEPEDWSEEDDDADGMPVRPWEG